MSGTQMIAILLMAPIILLWWLDTLGIDGISAFSTLIAAIARAFGA